MDFDDSYQSWQKDFPIEEAYKDAHGHVITFKITARETPAGFLIQAEESAKSKKKRFGYTFTKFSPINPYLALGYIRDKIRKRLSTKFIEYSEKEPQLTHDRLVGIIDYSNEDGEVVLQVDGNKITMNDLYRILSGYEGFEILLDITEQ